MDKHRVLLQAWEEKANWGRADAVNSTIHLSEVARRAYIKAYWDSMPDEVPDSYITPSGEAKWIEVDDDLFQELMRVQTTKNQQGLRIKEITVTTYGAAE
jgi:hypothetical protein